MPLKEKLMATAGLDRILEEFVTTWSSHDMDRVLPLYTADCTYEDVTLGAINHGKDELRGFGKLFISGFPDVTFELASQFVAVNGSWAAGEWMMTGTHRGDLPGLPATGKPISIRGVSILELLDNKIRRCSDYWDMATLLKQIGLMAEAEEHA
jgi:steroid delta-isomerase-like uncharacterized protein